MHNENHCRILADDRAMDGPWIGCYIENGRQGECAYWLHAKWKGFPYTTKKSQDNADFFCCSHYLKLVCNIIWLTRRKQATGTKKRKIFKMSSITELVIWHDFFNMFRNLFMNRNRKIFENALHKLLFPPISWGRTERKEKCHKHSSW